MDYIATDSGKLYQPLGLWLHSGPKLNRAWPYYFDYKREVLIIRTAEHSFQLAPRLYSSCAQAVPGYPATGVFHRPRPVPTSWKLPHDCYPVHAEEYADILLQRYRIQGPAPGVHVSTVVDMSTADTIQDMRKKTAPWEARLFANTEISTTRFSSMISTVIHPPPESHTCRVPCHLFLMAEGSIGPQANLSAWNCSTSDGTIYAKSASLEPSCTPTNRRGHLKSVLAAIRFVLRVGQNLIHTTSLKVHIICPSAAAIREIRSLRAYTEPFPTTTLRPDWDLIKAILDTLNECQSYVTISDGGKVYVDKSIDHAKPSQIMTVGAIERLMKKLRAKTTRKLQELRRSPSGGPRLPMIPSTQCRLHLNSLVPVHGNLKTAIHRAATEPTYRKYLQKRYKWNDVTHNAINWHAHHQALKKMPTKHQWLTKFIHGKLPTMRWLYKVGEAQSPNCPACELAPESFLHLLTCTKYDKWRKDFLATLCTFFNTEADSDRPGPDLYRIMELILTDAAIDIDTFDPSTHVALREQEKIGWHQLLLGRLSSQLHVLFQDTTAQARRKDPFVQFMQLTWKSMFLLWQHRNEMVHGRDTRESQQIQRAVAIHDIQQLCQMCSKMCCRDQALIPTDPTTFATDKTTAHLDRWRTMYGPWIRDSVKHAQKLAIHHTRPITTYFQPNPSTQRTSHPRPRPRTALRAHTRHDGSRPRKRKVYPDRSRPLTTFFPSISTSQP